jgi:hypothetical protein
MSVSLSFYVPHFHCDIYLSAEQLWNVKRYMIMRRFSPDVVCCQDKLT